MRALMGSEARKRYWSLSIEVDDLLIFWKLARSVEILLINEVQVFFLARVIQATYPPQRLPSSSTSINAASNAQGMTHAKTFQGTHILFFCVADPLTAYPHVNTASVTSGGSMLVDLLGILSLRLLSQIVVGLRRLLFSSCRLGPPPWRH